MRPRTPEPTQEEMNRTFEQLRAHLKPKVLADVMHSGLRDSVINEYKDLALATRDLIDLLNATGAASLLMGKAVEQYEHILAKFSVSGQRMRLLIDESSAVDETALLAIAGDEYSTVN
ncbi:hypothetical protein [Desulfocurvus sp. DL9XJH121]